MLSPEHLNILAKHIPAEALSGVAEIIKEHSINLIITNARSTKLGDFRAPFKGAPARLSVNGDLNQYSFLITLVHEMAHWMVWEKQTNFRNIKPHGKEWKEIYKDLIQQFLKETIFPEPLLSILKKHMLNPKASSTSDIHLMRELKKYDGKEIKTVLSDLAIGSNFQFRGNKFEILKKNRTRFLCREKKSKRKFLIHALVEIDHIEN